MAPGGKAFVIFNFPPGVLILQARCPIDCGTSIAQFVQGPFVRGRSPGVAKHSGLDQALERRREIRIVLANRAAPATGTANPSLRAGQAQAGRTGDPRRSAIAAAVDLQEPARAQPKPARRPHSHRSPCCCALPRSRNPMPVAKRLGS